MKRLIISLLIALTISGCTGKGSEIVPPPSENAVVEEISWSIEDRDLNEVLSERSLTMVNVWATFCPPCLDEMPDLGELALEYKDSDFQIVGVIADVTDLRGNKSDSQIELAEEILTKTRANYLHLIPSADLMDTLLADVSVVPTTFFFDSEGTLIGSIVLGAKNKSEWTKEINNRLEEIGNE